MGTKTNEYLPQVSAEGGSLTADSDRVQAPVVGAGPKDSGEDQSHVLTSIFGRRDRIGRSPIRPWTGSLGTEMESVISSAKRPREEDEEHEVDEGKRILDKLARVTAELVELIDKNINTKMDIKSRIRLVKRLVDNMKYQRQEDTEQRTKQLFVSKGEKPQMVCISANANGCQGDPTHKRRGDTKGSN